MAITKDPLIPTTETLMDSVVKSLKEKRVAKLVTWQKKELVGIFDENPDSFPAVYLTIVTETPGFEKGESGMNILTLNLLCWVLDEDFPERAMERLRKRIDDAMGEDVTHDCNADQVLFAGRQVVAVQDGYGIFNMQYNAIYSYDFGDF